MSRDVRHLSKQLPRTVLREVVVGLAEGRSIREVARKLMTRPRGDLNYEGYLEHCKYVGRVREWVQLCAEECRAGSSDHQDLTPAEIKKIVSRAEARLLGEATTCDRWPEATPQEQEWAERIAELPAADRNILRDMATHFAEAWEIEVTDQLRALQPVKGQSTPVPDPPAEPR